MLLMSPFPYQHFLTQEIRIAAAKSHRPEFMSLYAGQGFPLATNLSASEIIPLLVEQTVASNSCSCRSRFEKPCL